MGNEPELPPFDFEPPLKLLLGMEELLLEDVEDMDSITFRRQTLALHREEVPLVNAFLIEVKIDAGEVAHTKAINFSYSVQKTVLSLTNVSAKTSCYYLLTTIISDNCVVVCKLLGRCI